MEGKGGDDVKRRWIGMRGEMEREKRKQEEGGENVEEAVDGKKKAVVEDEGGEWKRGVERGKS